MDMDSPEWTRATCKKVTLRHTARYGNKAYRLWHDRLQADGLALVLALLPPELHPAATELHVYLAGGCGLCLNIMDGNANSHRPVYFVWIITDGIYRAVRE